MTSLFTAIAGDLSSPAFLVALAVSLAGTVAGVLAFRHNRLAADGTTQRAGRARTALYWISLSPSLVWYVMPFLPQTRFPALMDGLAGDGVAALVVGLAGAAAAVRHGYRAMRVVAENRAATGPAMVNFLQPAALLDGGAYARIRHPMFLNDLLTHIGLAAAAGALTTLLAMPLYFLMSAAFNVAEERWVLAPRFGAAFDEYRRRVPGYMTIKAAVVIVALAGLAAAAALFQVAV